MNDRQLIKNLKLLNRLSPSSETMAELKKEIFMHVKTGESKSSRDNVFSFLFAQNARAWNPMVAMAMFALVAVFIFGFIFNGAALIPDLQSKATQVQIALAPNKLAKSKIALAEANRQLEVQKTSVQTNIGSVKTIANSTLQTNNLLASLSLMGEAGKYTRVECQNMYKEYDKYLISLQSTIEDREKNTKEEAVLTELNRLEKQITAYEAQTDARLNLYK
jgi:hypothetical protein